MPRGLRRFQESGQSHFITFSCYRRQPKFVNAAVYDLFPPCLEDMRRRFDLRIYGYVVMPEHVHLLLSEPEHGTLSEAIHYLKLSFAKRLRSRTIAQVSVQKKDANLGHRVSAKADANLGHRVSAKADANLGHRVSQKTDANLGHQLGSFWQKRYYDRNVRDAREFMVKLRYLHRNPVKRGLVKEPGDWKWSSFRHYAFRENGVVEIESEWTARDRELKTLGGLARTFLSPG
ncbi:MAG: REP-associated tyrosine transposase [Terriglobales bacterium]